MARKRRNVEVKATEEMVGDIMRAAFPSWRGKTVEILAHDGKLNLASYWSGGSRDYWSLVRLPDLKSVEVPQQSMFDPKIEGVDRYQMVPGVIVVKLAIFQGKKMTPKIYVHPDNLSQMMLPTGEDLDPLEVIVLLATRSYKSSYGGVKNYRFQEAKQWTGITWQEWEETKARLIDRKLLNKRGAITMDGRNALDDFSGGKFLQLHSLPKLR